MKIILEYTELLEQIYEISIAVLLLFSILTLRLFRKIRRERKLSLFESLMFLVLKIAIFLWLASFLLLNYGDYLP